MTSFADQIRGMRVGLAMASGFFGFYHHAGVLRAVVERGIKPCKVTGTSAGALVASMYAAGLEPEDIASELLSVQRGDFWDVQFPLTKLGFGLLGGHRFKSTLARVLPVHGFAECRVPLAVGSYDLDEGRVCHLDKGPLIPAVYASAAYPYLFKPAQINGVRYWDGGFGEKTPLVPFLKGPGVDVVLVSYMAHKSARDEGDTGGSFRSMLPSFTSLFADTPQEELLERDQASVKVLREAGVRVLVMAPERVWLGPFSLEKAEGALERGYAGACEILDSSDESLLGRKELS